MKNILFILLLLISQNSFGQTEDEYWAKWDSNYSEVDIASILICERNYADSVESNLNIAPYYARFDKYKFAATYQGKYRKVTPATLKSMQRVCKLFVGNSNALDLLCHNEALFKVDSIEIWMPIQTQILDALKQEVKKGNSVILYCSFFNEHTG